MERTIVTVHIASFSEVNRVMRTLSGLPDVIRVEALGFEPGAVRFAVEHEGIVPLDFRLRDQRLTPWQVHASTDPTRLEIWIA